MSPVQSRADQKARVQNWVIEGDPRGTTVRFSDGIRSLVLALAASSCHPVVTNIGVAWIPDAGGAGPEGGVDARVTDAISSLGIDDSSPDSVPDMLEDAGPCPPDSGDLSNIGGGDFRISFTLSTRQTATLVALLNQRATCDSQFFYWDIRMLNGLVFAEIDNNLYYTDVIGVDAAVNDGQSHAVLVERRSLMLALYVDGRLTSVQSAPATLGGVPPLQVGVDVCNGGPPGDGTVTLIGMITNVCVSPE